MKETGGIFFDSGLLDWSVLLIFASTFSFNKKESNVHRKVRKSKS